MLDSSQITAQTSSTEGNNADRASAARLWFVRVGILGQVGRFQLADAISIARRDRVVCRTARGIEVGEVLGPVSDSAARHNTADGRVLRRMAPEDHMLWGHLQELGQQALAECAAWLAEQGDEATLLEVEPLLDGKTLYFHFLQPVDEPIQSRLDELVAVYEQNVRSSKFANLVEHGCGPGCGTAQAKNGCGSQGGCAVCKVASACKKPSGS